MQDILPTKMTWLITGVAGFIGSHLLEAVLRQDQYVVGLDNFSTGSFENLTDVRRHVDTAQWDRFTLVEGDIRNPSDCAKAIQTAQNISPHKKLDCILHQAAVASVQHSIQDPTYTHDVNVTGFLTLLTQAREANIKRIVYASSSAVYGDDPAPIKTEDRIGAALSPYAASKYMGEQYAHLYNTLYGMENIGLRYFNVFGPRQNPNGSYAAVIPKWIHAIETGAAIEIHGNGQPTRDFCSISNIVLANLAAARTHLSKDTPTIYNIGTGCPTSLNDLYTTIQEICGDTSSRSLPPTYTPLREGDILHSCADITRAQTFLGYAPSDSLQYELQRMNQRLNDNASALKQFA